MTKRELEGSLADLKVYLKEYHLGSMTGLSLADLKGIDSAVELMIIKSNMR